MAEQPSLFDVRQELRDALDAVDEHADEQWKEAALAAVHRTCLARADFISDDVWDVGELESTREDRALGPVLLRAAKMQWCVKTDRVRPSRRSHLSGKPVWRSLIHSTAKGAR